MEAAILVRAGLSRNGNLHVPEVMASTYPGALEGVPVRFGHQEDLGGRTDPRNVAGFVRNVRFRPEDETVRGDLEYLPTAEPVLEAIWEARTRGPDLFGLSIAADAKTRIVKFKGKAVRKVEALENAPEKNSVDIVVHPSAGGRIFEGGTMAEFENITLEELKAARPDLVAAIEEEVKQKLAPSPAEAEEKVEEEGESPVTAKEVEEAVKKAVEAFEVRLMADQLLREANLPAEMDAKIREGLRQRPDLGWVEQEIAFFKKLAGKMAAPPEAKGGATVGLEPSDRLQLALDGLFKARPKEELEGVKPFRSLREAYVAFTGDEDLEGRVRITEAWNTTNWARALANTLYRLLLADYRAAPTFWRRIAVVRNVPDFREHHNVKVGYISDLPAVDTEASDYPLLSDPTDERTIGNVGQRGGIIEVTRKVIVNDDIGLVAKIAGRLGRAAARTLDKHVWVTMIENNAIYRGVDNNPFFHARAGTNGPTNVRAGGVQLSPATLASAISMMEGFTEPSSNERFLSLSPGDTLLVVPAGLRWTAVAINQYKPVETLAPGVQGWHGEKNEDILVVPWLTTAANPANSTWYLMLKPEVIEWISVLFLRGREEPELFLADNPLVGEYFDADLVRYKVRFEFGAMFDDCRGAIRNNPS